MEHQEWYKEWFQTKYYDILYIQRDENEAEVFISNLLMHLNLPKGSYVWDNACGKGRHAFIFSKFGYNVIATDLCEKCIEFANNKYSLPNLSFFVHDMRREFYVNFFDLVINLFTSLGYFEYDYEDRKAIKVIVDALKNESFLVLDFLNPKYVKQNIVPHETFLIDNVQFKIERSINNNIVTKKISIIDNGQEYTYCEKVKLLSQEFFLTELERNKAEVLNVFGDYQLNGFSEKDSPRMIFIGQKKV
jgi:SAM-dependent methyltransferase